MSATVLSVAVLMSYVERAEDGSVDMEKTLEKFEGDLVKFVAERETETETIAAAVAAIFDEHRGASINMPAVCTFALSKLNAQPENYTILHERVADYVRSNSQGEVKDGVAERPDSLFVIKKGKGGGVQRRADIPPKPNAAK